MTTTKASSETDIRTALENVSIPEFGEPEYSLSINNYDPESDTQSQIDAWPGDIIEKNPPASTLSDYKVVIDLTDDALIYYVPDEHRFANYPIEFLEEDLEHTSTAYHQQVL